MAFVWVAELQSASLEIGLDRTISAAIWAARTFGKRGSLFRSMEKNLAHDVDLTRGERKLLKDWLGEDHGWLSSGLPKSDEKGALVESLAVWVFPDRETRLIDAEQLLTLLPEAVSRSLDRTEQIIVWCEMCRRSTSDEIQRSVENLAATFANLAAELSAAKPELEDTQQLLTQELGWIGSRLTEIYGSLTPRQSLPAPAVPSPFVDRPEELQEITAALLSEDEGALAIVSQLKGEGGFGKSVLAAAVCHQPIMRTRYGDRIFWLEFGQEADALALSGSLVACMTDDLFAPFTSLAQAVEALETVVVSEPTLLVLDDIWYLNDVIPFLDSLPPQCRILITTRLHELVPNAQTILVDRLKSEEAMQLLCTAIGEEGRPRPDVVNLLPYLQNWPLLIQLAGRVVRVRVSRYGDSVADAVSHLISELVGFGITAFDKSTRSRSDAIGATIEIGLTLLPSTSRDHIDVLAALVEDVNLPLSDLVPVLEISPARVESSIFDMAEAGLVLLDLGAKEVRLHDTVREYLRSNSQRLVDAHAKIVKGFPGTQAVESAYMLKYLSYHYAAAGRALEFSNQLTTDWLRRRRHLEGNSVGFAVDVERTLRGVRSSLNGSSETASRLVLYSAVVAQQQRFVSSMSMSEASDHLAQVRVGIDDLVRQLHRELELSGNKILPDISAELRRLVEDNSHDERLLYECITAILRHLLVGRHSFELAGHLSLLAQGLLDGSAGDGGYGPRLKFAIHLVLDEAGRLQGIEQQVADLGTVRRSADRAQSECLLALLASRHGLGGTAIAHLDAAVDRAEAEQYAVLRSEALNAAADIALDFADMEKAAEYTGRSVRAAGGAAPAFRARLQGRASALYRKAGNSDLALQYGRLACQAAIDDGVSDAAVLGLLAEPVAVVAELGHANEADEIVRSAVRRVRSQQRPTLVGRPVWMYLAEGIPWPSGHASEVMALSFNLADIQPAAGVRLLCRSAASNRDESLLAAADQLAKPLQFDAMADELVVCSWVVEASLMIGASKTLDPYLQRSMQALDHCRTEIGIEPAAAVVAAAQLVGGHSNQFWSTVNEIHGESSDPSWMSFALQSASLAERLGGRRVDDEFYDELAFLDLDSTFLEEVVEQTAPIWETRMASTFLDRFADGHEIGASALLQSGGAHGEGLYRLHRFASGADLGRLGSRAADEVTEFRSFLRRAEENKAVDSDANPNFLGALLYCASSPVTGDAALTNACIEGALDQALGTNKFRFDSGHLLDLLLAEGSLVRSHAFSESVEESLRAWSETNGRQPDLLASRGHLAQGGLQECVEALARELREVLAPTRPTWGLSGFYRQTFSRVQGLFSLANQVGAGPDLLGAMTGPRQNLDIAVPACCGALAVDSTRAGVLDFAHNLTTALEWAALSESD